MRRRTLVVAGLSLALATTVTSAASAAKRFFDASETQRIKAFWEEDGRYTIAAPPNHRERGLWQVRLTPEGSLWLRQYSRSRGLGKTPPNQVAGAQNSDQQVWESWINAKILFDRSLAALEARRRNVEQLGVAMPALSDVANPGPAPESLVAQVGSPPPPFAECVAPMLHTVVFEDGGKHSWQDHPDMRPRFEYYRFREGVMDGGTPMRRLPEAEVNDLLSRAGIDSSLRRVLAAVSLLEGGFDSINTYDTGFVSVGFIQFASLSAGAGSLGRVLLRQKRDNPDSFERDFQRYGLDVTPEGVLVALDLATGEERLGPAANAEIIEDKRLIAVFQRAGRLSAPHRVSQLRVAVDEYHPANDNVMLTVDGRIFTGKVGEIIRSEAGLATLMDRKVNTGKLDPLVQVLTRVAQREKITRFADLADHEWEIVTAMRWRKSYLEDTTLTKPARKPDTSSQGQPNFPPNSPR